MASTPATDPRRRALVVACAGLVAVPRIASGQAPGEPSLPVAHVGQAQ